MNAMHSIVLSRPGDYLVVQVLCGAYEVAARSFGLNSDAAAWIRSLGLTVPASLATN